MGYKFQFITLAGFHALNYSMFDLARGYAHESMTAYVRLQEGRGSLPRRWDIPPPGISGKSAPAA
jgi:isocitrate lyase